MPALLDRDPQLLKGKSLVKVGFSNTPARRCDEHNAALPPAAKFKWKLAAKSARAFVDGAAAKAGEDYLKSAFDQHFESLGGEFFLGDLDAMRMQLALIPEASFQFKAPAVASRR